MTLASRRTLLVVSMMALGLMLLSAVGPYLLFKLRGWL